MLPALASQLAGPATWRDLVGGAVHISGPNASMVFMFIKNRSIAHLRARFRALRSHGAAAVSSKLANIKCKNVHIYLQVYA